MADSPSVNLETHDFLGYAETNLAQVVSTGHNGCTLQLQQNKSKYYPILPKQAKQSKGTIILLAEELIQYKEEVSVCPAIECLLDPTYTQTLIYS